MLCFPHFYWTYYDRDEAEIAALIAAEAVFWENVQNNVPPEIDGSDSTERAIEAQYASGGADGVVSLERSGIPESLMMIAECKAQIKDLEEIQKAHENKIKEAMGDAALGMAPGWKVSWKNQSRSTIDTKRLKDERPELYDEYLKTSESRVFRITKLKEKKGS